jgi:hypothetical protein
MRDAAHPKTPPLPSPPPRQNVVEDRHCTAKFPVDFNPPSETTAPLPSPMQRRHDHDRVTKSRRFLISDLTCVRLCHRIQKIYQMATNVVDGFTIEYTNRHDKPLPQASIDKIMLLYYHNRIERRCIEVGLTVEEEEAWNIREAKVDFDALSESGEESEEHDSDNVNIYLGLEDDDDDDKDDDDDDKDPDGGEADDVFGDNANAHQISKCEDEIKKLCENLATDITILKRMTHSLNRKNPYLKFDEWEAWKTNDVNVKIDELDAKILTLRDGLKSPLKLPTRKRGKKSN